MPSMFMSYIKAFKNIVFPRLCLSCEKKIPRGYLCSNCQDEISFSAASSCYYCAKTLAENSRNYCRICSRKIYPYNRIISATTYKEPLVSLIHLFKYRNYDYLGPFLSNLILKHLRKIGFNSLGYNFIIPVPMHKDKLKTRGYNQAKILANILANYFKIPLRDDIIDKINIKPSQTKLRKHKRQQNVEGTFIARKEIQNKKIILVDDIFTTGATINACSKILRQIGADKITVITLSKT